MKRSALLLVSYLAVGLAASLTLLWHLAEHQGWR
jgi:hypothetical protein